MALNPSTVMNLSSYNEQFPSIFYLSLSCSTGLVPKKDEFVREPVILIGSSSRCTRSTSRAQKLKDVSCDQVLDVVNTGKLKEYIFLLLYVNIIEMSMVLTTKVLIPTVTPPELNADQILMEEIGKKRKSLGDESSDDEKVDSRYETIRTRTSPRTLYETVIGLSESQKDVLCDLGLGSIARMTTNGLPYRLGFYVVDSFDPSNMHLKVSGGVILITIRSIHELLGVPTGGVDLIEAPDTEFGFNLVKEWRQQFSKPNPRPSDVSRVILESDDFGLMFKVNFLVLFANLMADCNSSGSCNLSFLSKIANEQMLSNIDWCEYLYERLRTSKERWKRDNPECFYSGPLTYLTVSAYLVL